MRPIRSLTPAIAALALIIVLAACAQVTATPPPSPSAPPTGSPTEAPTEAPTESPRPIPTETPAEVVDHDVPLTGRVTADGVDVRALPDADAPLIRGESFDPPGDTPEVRLNTGDLVVVTLGPVVADGESWYQVDSVDGADLVFAFGWVPGDQLAREGDAPDIYPVVVGVSEQGSGGTAGTDVLAGSPVSVRFAATPMADADGCDLEVTLVRTDGTAVNVATESVTDAIAVEMTPNDLSSLFQEQAGTATLEVETDCSFAAALITPQS